MNESDRGAILLRNILEVPADDTARLVYADWLEENGQGGRAEFVRVQVELARLSDVDKPRFAGPVFADEMDEVEQYCRSWERKKKLVSRERELVDYLFWRGLAEEGGGYKVAHTAGYCPPDRRIIKLFPPNGGGEIANVDFSRGFVSDLRLPMADFLTHAAAIFAKHPVTSVRLTDRRPHAHVDGWVILRFNASINAGLPDKLFDELVISTEEELAELCSGYPILRDFDRRRPDGALYLTPERADTALSRACVSFGRKAAGLSPLQQLIQSL